jgi:G3E family GTPase
VHIITGFLGVGKTSCIQHLIKHKPRNERWAILVNEYGQQGIDGSLFHADELIVKQVAGGCACCAALLPFQTALNQLIRHEKPDRIFIEPSGLGHVDNIAKLLQDDSYKTRLMLNAVVCLIDPRHLSQPKYRYHELYLRQLNTADLYVANKCELAADNDLVLFDELCLERNRNNLKVRHAELNLIDIEKPAIKKTNPLQLYNQTTAFHTKTLNIDNEQYDVSPLMRDLVALGLTRIKGLLVMNDQIAAINISEHESKLEYFSVINDQVNQSSTVECIDVKPIDINTISTIINGHKCNE